MKHNRSRFQPRLETLEDRQTPAVVHWTGAAGDHQWLTAGNWENDQLPTADDDVILKVEANDTIVYAGGDSTINSLESSENLDLTSGTLTVLNGLSFGDGTFTESGGTLQTPVNEIFMTMVPGDPSEETPVEETPVEETPVEETPVEETPVEEPPVEEEAPPEEVTEDPPPVLEDNPPVDETPEPPPEVVVTSTPNPTRPPKKSSTVVIPPPATLVIDLQASSDAGVSNSDNLTNRTTVVFDVTVNHAGTLRLDVNGDGLPDLRQNLMTPGKYEITASGLVQGTRTVTGRLIPVAAVTPVVTTMQLTIDTTAPRLVPHPSRSLSPVSSRELEFTEVLDSATLTPEDVVVLRPDGTQAAVSGISGTGRDFLATFATSSVWGRYEVRVGPDVRDLAGNRMDQDNDGVNGETGEDVGIDRFFVNQAPSLDNSGNMQLRAIRMNDVSNRGISVRKLLTTAGGDRITDIDPGAKEGIAVVGVNDTNGKWQYSQDGGITWKRFKVTSPSAARLLNANGKNRIRFIPNQNFVGSVNPGLTFHAWDRTDGMNGGTFAINETGGASAFSALTETASIEVTA